MHFAAKRRIDEYRLHNYPDPNCTAYGLAESAIFTDDCVKAYSGFTSRYDGDLLFAQQMRGLIGGTQQGRFHTGNRHHAGMLCMEYVRMFHLGVYKHEDEAPQVLPFRGSGYSTWWTWPNYEITDYFPDPTARAAENIRRAPTDDAQLGPPTEFENWVASPAYTDFVNTLQGMMIARGANFNYGNSD